MASHASIIHHAKDGRQRYGLGCSFILSFLDWVIARSCGESSVVQCRHAVQLGQQDPWPPKEAAPIWEGRTAGDV